MGPASFTCLLETYYLNVLFAALRVSGYYKAYWDLLLNRSGSLDYGAEGIEIVQGGSEFAINVSLE